MLEASLALEVPQNECTHIKTFRIEGDAIIKELHGVAPQRTVYGNVRHTHGNYFRNHNVAYYFSPIVIGTLLATSLLIQHSQHRSYKT